MGKITFYGGINEIGGNKILLEDRGTKILLDFGMSFGQSNKFFAEFVQPRKCNGIGDFLETGLLPDVKGLYREDYLKRAGRVESLDCHGLLLSHAHADHSSFIHHLRADLPIYCSKATYAILKALNDTASTSFGELTELVVAFETYVNRNGEISRKQRNINPEIVVPRKFSLFDFQQKFRIDDFEIVPYEVDHSLPGATGYIIHSPSGTIVYTGDLRFTGRRKEKSYEFLAACAKEKPDLLLIEGTRVTETASKSEEDVEAAVSKISLESQALTVCNWPIRDVDRMTSFLNAAKNIGKKLTVSLKQAYLLDCLNGQQVENVPKLGDDALRLYAMRKSWGLIGECPTQRLVNQDYDKWEQNYLPEAICHKEVGVDQNKYLFFASNFDLKELIDLKPLDGSAYIKSVCEPYDDEMRFDWKRTENWINHFKLKLHRAHVSGHASGPQLKEFIEKVEPNLIVPIHTEHPECYSKWFKNVQLIKNNGNFITL
jgi:ribonuclease J